MLLRPPPSRALALPLLALLVLVGSPAEARDTGRDSDRVLQAILRTEAAAATLGFGVANSSCGTCDTVWVGHSAAGPGGAFLGVGISGVWDFDSGTAGTDTSQGWTNWVLPYRTGGTRPAHTRLEWAYAYGNNVNRGNRNLWLSRETSGRKYVETGVVGVWHSDTMVGVKSNIADPAEPSSTVIAGVRSAWCGLREPGNLSAIDPVTGNAFNADLQLEEHEPQRRSEYPGYSNLWDQMLYKDFSAPVGSGTVAFTYRTDLATGVDPLPGGSGWLDPDPASLANFVNNTEDVFQVWVGTPNDVAYDTDRRWFSEVLDFTQPVQMLFQATGKTPANTDVVRAFGGIVPVSGRIRVVFRVKTNRVDSDEDTDTPFGFNSKEGAALIDRVSVNGGALEGFETTAQILPRSLIFDLGAPGGPWASTGKPPGADHHVEHISALLYEDIHGAVGAPTRLCNLTGNLIATGNHDDPSHVHTTESLQAIESPTINLAIRTGVGKNDQGIDAATAARPYVKLNYDWYTGFNTLDESVFMGVGVRYHGPDMVAPISGARQWSPILLDDALTFGALPECHNVTRSLSDFDVPFGAIDSLRISLFSETQGWRFAGTNLGNTRGGYFDNIRVGFSTIPPSRTPELDAVLGIPPGPGPEVQLKAWNRLQDTFPFNESVTPGSHAEFDTTTALIVTGLNIVQPATEPGTVAGDSLVARVQFTGDGVVTGTRVDLVFRIDPGPGNYVVKGDRNSALVNKDPAHPFFAHYLAGRGRFGTDANGSDAGTPHPGGVWDRHSWNSCRMDTAEINIHPIVSRGIGNFKSNTWMGTIHESDPKFQALGIVHNRCFLVDPAGANDETNIDCSGTAPGVYAGVSGVTREGTKILPDGWFTPGTHIEYYLRGSYIENPALADLTPNPDMAWPHMSGFFPDFDAERHASVDVLPDMWKDSRFGGPGLACILVIDGADRRGADNVYVGAADTAGYGKNNGATSGWKRTGPTHNNPNVVGDYVLENRGQYGLSFDHYDIQGAEAIEGGRPGSRLALNSGAIANKGAKCGPTSDMLGTFYKTIVWLTGDLSNGTLHDGVGVQESANDLLLLQDFIDGATPSNRRAVWLSGDGIVEDGTLHSPDLGTFLLNYFGATLVSENYEQFTGNTATTARLRNEAFWSLQGVDFGIRNQAGYSQDVLDVDALTAPGAQVAAHYVDQGGNLHVASVFRLVDPGVRDYKLLIDGFNLAHLRGVTTVPQGQPTVQLDNSNGRRYRLENVLGLFFGYCPRIGPVVGVGDVPGMSASPAPGLLVGTAPNPAYSGQGIGITFTLAADREVTVRFYNAAGREVARRTMVGKAGSNRMAWDGVLAGGTRAAAGVYFYRIDGLGEGAHGDRNRIVLLGP